MSNLVLTRDGVYRSSEPMQLETIQRAAPAALSIEAHESRSDKYQPISTMKVVEALRRSTGVEVFGATQARTRDSGKANSTKHVLRLRRPHEFDGADDVPELILTNSYDGSTSYKLELGCYRFVCANGLTVGETWDSTRVKHIGDQAIPKVIDETIRLARKFDTIRDTVDHFKQVALNPRQQLAFGRAALELRHDTDHESVDPQDIVRPHRTADRDGSLWATLNVAQERLIRGGYQKSVKDQDGYPTRRRVRPIKGIDQNSAINRAIWTLAEEMAALA